MSQSGKSPDQTGGFNLNVSCIHIVSHSDNDQLRFLGLTGCLYSRVRNRAPRWLLPILPAMPEPQNIDNFIGQFIPHFIITHDDAANITRQEFFKSYTKLRVLHELFRTRNKLSNDLCSRMRIDRNQKSMKPDQIPLSACGPSEFHLSRLLAQASIAA